MDDSATIFENEDFESFNMSTSAQARGKHCGAAMNPNETDRHKCPAKPEQAVGL